MPPRKRAASVSSLSSLSADESSKAKVSAAAKGKGKRRATRGKAEELHSAIKLAAKPGRASKTKAAKALAVKQEEDAIADGASSDLSSENAAPTKKKARLSNGKAKPSPRAKKAKDEGSGDEPEDGEAKPKKERAPRKPKVPKVDPFSAEAIAAHPLRLGPYASGHAESTSSPWTDSTGKPTHRIGAHTSASGGVEFALSNASELGASALALFVKSQRKWSSPPIKPESVDLFKRMMLETSAGGLDYSSDYILPHGSYLINLANPDAEKRETSYACFIDDLRRCESLGVKLYNWHPGSTTGGCTKAEACRFIGESINRAHAETDFIIPVLENMAGAGNIVGSTFEELADIISHVKNKDRVGVCIDTCHTFAAGYDLRTKDTYEATMKAFDDVVGLRYLKGMHINDSKGGGLNCKKDRHENIGQGELGLNAFRLVVQDPRTAHIPLILETPTFEETGVWAREIGALYELQGVIGSDEDVADRLKEMTEELRVDIAAIRKANGKEDKKGKTAKAAKEDNQSDPEESITKPSPRKTKKKKRIVMIAVGGPTCSGKTLLAKHLAKILPNSFIIHQDDFAPAQDLIPYHPDHPDTQDWDTPSTAIDWSRFRRALQHARKTAAALPDHKGHDHLNKQVEVNIGDEIRQRWITKFQEMKTSWEKNGENVKFVVVDGFLLYWDESCAQEYDVKLFLRVPYATLKRRREERQQYVTQSDVWVDPPQYFDNIVYPAYKVAHQKMFTGEDVEDGQVDDDYEVGKGMEVFKPVEGQEGMERIVEDAFKAIERAVAAV